MMLPKYFIYGFISLCLMLESTAGNMRCGTLLEGCPDTWNQWGNNCYKATANLPWLEAKQECIMMGGVLVVPKSVEETNFLLNINSWFWIDYTDLQGLWECQEGTTDVEYRNWAVNQPSGTYGDIEEHCAEVWTPRWSGTTGKWNDESCDKEQAAICKMPVKLQLHF